MKNGLAIRQDFVTFLSPGSFVHETTTKRVNRWHVDEAVEMSKSITERYGATPFGFYFATRGRGDGELDSREVARSGVYYLNGVIESVNQIEKRGDPGERTLLKNMRGNGWDRVVRNTRGYRWTQPFRDGDVVLERSREPEGPE